MEPLEPGRAPATQPSSGCGKWVLGCAIGCGVLSVLFFLAVAGAGWWFVKPGEQHPTDAAVAPDSSGAFRVADLAEHEGARQALEAVVRESNRRHPPATRSRTDRPTWIQSDDPEALAQFLSWLLPREGTIAFQRVPGHDQPSPVLALNLRGMTRPLRMILENDEHGVEPYRGVSIVREEGGDTLLAMVDGTLLVAEDLDAVRATIDRIRDGRVQGLDTSFEILEPAGATALLSGATTLEPGELARSLREEGDRDEPLPVDPATLASVTRFELLVEDLDAERVHFRLGLAAASPAEADAAARSMATVLRDEMAPAVLRTSVRTRGRSAILEGEITEWVGPVADWLAKEANEDQATDERPGQLERTPG